MFEVVLSSHAKKFLRGAERQVAARIVEKMDKLADDPFPPDVKRIVNRKEKIFRVRVGDYRIQYSVIFDKKIVFVSDVDKRGRAYD